MTTSMTLTLDKLTVSEALMVYLVEISFIGFSFCHFSLFFPPPPFFFFLLSFLLDCEQSTLW